jgi:hypothetical protein
MNNGPMDEAALRRRFPHVDFESPVKVTLPSKKGWACRYCVAKEGMSATSGAEVFPTYADWAEHIVKKHTPIPKPEEGQ